MRFWYGYALLLAAAFGGGGLWWPVMVLGKLACVGVGGWLMFVAGEQGYARAMRASGRSR